MAILSSELAFLNRKRKTFVGKNDKYARSRLLRIDGELSETLINFGFANVPGSSKFFSEAYKDSAQDRFTKYKQYFRFYTGDHWLNPWEGGERKPVFNFCQPIIDRTADFFVARGFEMRGIEGNEKYAEALDVTWEGNDKVNLSRKAVKTSMIFGECYVYVTVENKGLNNELLPREEWRIRYYVIPPYFCYPIWEGANYDVMSAALIQIPIKSEEEKPEDDMYSILITPKEFRIFINGKSLGSPIENMFREVNVVHFPNEPMPGTAFGVSDLEQIIPLNEEYNSIAHSVRRIIKYHAEPTTIIYGAKASRLEKGADKVWSGLPGPQEAKVENLVLSSDLITCEKYLERTEGMLYKIAQFPEQVLEPTKAISNTSGVALQTVYQPLIDKVERKRQVFSTVVKKVNRLTEIGYGNIIGEDIVVLADRPKERHKTTVRYTSVLPVDEKDALDTALKRLNAGVSSRALEMRRLHKDLVDTERLALEIVADRIADLALKKEEAQALNGKLPDLSAALMDSIGINEDFKDLAKKIKDLVEREAKTISEENEEKNENELIE